MTEPYLIFMIGIPGSGKTTNANVLSLVYSAEVFSSDKYRKKLLGDENDQSNNELVFNTLYKDIAYNLSLCKSCIFDATNINTKNRMNALNKIESYLRKKFKSEIVYRKIATPCLTNILECIENDKNRERSVGEQVILKFISRFEYPQYFEGFDDIIPLFGKSVNIIKREDLFNRMSGFNQNSKYHKYDLLTHSLVLSDFYNNDDFMKEVSLFHDIGKLFTETKDKEGFSHYYQHANYSAYIIACNPDIVKYYERYKSYFNFNAFIFYINQHMHIRDIIKSEKAIKKYKELWGEDLFQSLVEFMNNDNKASGRDIE